jgi:hypothetical protein
LDIAADDYSSQPYFYHGNKKNFTHAVQAVKALCIVVSLQQIANLTNCNLRSLQLIDDSR